MMDNPYVCPHCEGEGVIWNNADPTSGQCFDCEECHGTGEAQEPAQDDGEPPYSYADHLHIQARELRDWGVF